MSRGPSDPMRLVRTRTLDELGLDLSGSQDPRSPQLSDTDKPKVVSAAADPCDIRNPTLEKYSKVLLGRGSTRVLHPNHLREWCKVGSFPSPLGTNSSRYNRGLSFVPETETVLLDIVASEEQTTVSRELLRAGPRESLSFHPLNQVKPCIVTCGGICPGLNNVIRELVFTLTKVYGVKEQVSGIQYGLRGFYSTDIDILPLTVAGVQGINHVGGSVLGSSRGGYDCKRILDSIECYGFNQVYMIGGDGTHRAINALFQESKKRKSCISFCGLTKSIDQIDRCFGFDSAVTESQRSIRCAKVEAKSAINGIGLVQLMGRHSGNIAMYASLASREVDCCLIPEVEFVLHGHNGLFEYVHDKLKEQGHMVIVIAEGAATNLVESRDLGTDASGNRKLPDVGSWLGKQIKDWAATIGLEINLKLINPTYIIRSVPANASDQLFCALLAQSAVHGAMAGYTGFTTGLVNTHLCFIPLDLIVNRKRAKVDVKSHMWNRLITATGQPILNGMKTETSMESLRSSDYEDDEGLSE